MKQSHHHDLIKIHEDVPANHYDRGIKYDWFKKYWHWRRFSEVLKAAPKINGSILDVGCHSGLFTKKISEKINPKKIFGVDISKKAIKEAQRRIKDGNFQVADAASLPFKKNSFNAVFCLEVLEHVDDPEKVITEIARVLKPKGYAVILVPLNTTLFRTIWFLWTLYHREWRHAHVYNFEADNLEKFLKRQKFKIEKVNLFNLGMLKLVVCIKK